MHWLSRPRPPSGKGTLERTKLSFPGSLSLGCRDANVDSIQSTTPSGQFHLAASSPRPSSGYGTAGARGEALASP